MRLMGSPVRAERRITPNNETRQVTNGGSLYAVNKWEISFAGIADII